MFGFFRFYMCFKILEELRKVKSEKEFYDDDDQNLEDYGSQCFPITVYLFKI